jgi:hypothetical protein
MDKKNAEAMAVVVRAADVFAASRLALGESARIVAARAEPLPRVRAPYEMVHAAAQQLSFSEWYDSEACEEHVLAIDDCCQGFGWSFSEYSAEYARRCRADLAVLRKVAGLAREFAQDTCAGRDRS